MKVFLGGTCAESEWRDNLIKMLEIDYFNPVVDDWTEECMEEEKRQRESCDFCLYVITPRMQGVYSIAEVVDDSNKQPKKTILCVLYEDKGNLPLTTLAFSKGQMKSLGQVGEMVWENGGSVFFTLKHVADFLKQRACMKHILLILLLSNPPASAYGPYNAEVVRVVDGDTIDVKINTFIDQIQYERLRLDGVDTPELRSSSPCERVLAKAAKTFTTDFLVGDVKITVTERGSFGRPLAKLTVGERDLGQELLEVGLGRYYVKKSLRKPWCENL